MSKIFPFFFRHIRHIRRIRQSGQSSMEYLFMLAAVTAIFLSVSDQLAQAIVGEGECPNESLVCQLQAGIGSSIFFDRQYKTFTLLR